MLKVLEDMTVFQPQRMLELVEFAIRNPATKPEGVELSKVYQYTHDDVLGELTPLLRRISFTLDFLPRCCDLLWQLGRDDDQNLSSHPNDPLHVLADVARYEIGKPFAANHAVLDAVERWLDSDPNVHGHVHSPLEIVDPMLAKTGLSSHSEGPRWALRSFALQREDIEPVRKRALDVVVHCLSSTDLKVIMRALASLESALREPAGLLGLQITDADRGQWRPEQVEILEQIERLAERSTEPLVHLRIGEALWWHGRYGQSSDIKE
ncbi:MAG: hypothetical protein AAB393_19845, partial [Bacteroidota bacterium]